MNREQQETVVDLLTAKLGKANQWGLAGRWLNSYGYETVCRVLEGMQDNVSIPYITGALKREKSKSVDFSLRQDLTQMTENWESA